MRIHLPEDFVTMPWRNGGGLTHEIARQGSADSFVWRLSVADVTADGPFSAFPGLTRVLTVIAGAGLVLRTPGGVIEARPLSPVRFPGDLAVHCRRIAGDVRDFNVIFDARAVAAAVTVPAGPFEVEGRTPGQTLAFLALRGRVLAGGMAVPAGAVATGTGPLVLAEGARGVLVRLRAI
ncbi:MAG: HutD family protein [Rhodobacteraceae bacterium]|nr:HutD family protein [Paracoccaceae bacterium]